MEGPERVGASFGRGSCSGGFLCVLFLNLGASYMGVSNVQKIHPAGHL